MSTLRTRLVSLVVVAHFFLPYVPSTRLRLDVVVAYVCLAILPFAFRSIQRQQRALVASAVLCALWCAVRIVLADQPISDRIAELTNYTFPLTAFATFVVLRRWLGSFENLVDALLVLSIPINLIAVLQSLDPNSAFNSEVFQLYGGYNSSPFTQYATYAEVMVKLGGRCTSIFNASTSLALYDVMVVTLATFAASNAGANRWRRTSGIVAGVFGLSGGLLAASKSFYFGFALATLVLLLTRRLRPLVTVAIAALVTGAWVPRLLKEATTTDTALMYLETAQNPSFDNTLGSRFGSGGFLRDTIDTVFGDPAILAVGAGPDNELLGQGDSAYLPLIVVGGIPLLLLFLWIIFVLGRLVVRKVMAQDANAAPMLALLVAFLGVGVGIPTFETGRIAPLFLLLCYSVLWGDPAAVTVAPDDVAARLPLLAPPSRIRTAAEQGARR